MLTTNIPLSALTNTNNITLTTLGYTWTLGVGSGVNGIYTFTGAPAVNIPANSVGEFVAILTITWNVPPPAGSYLVLATVSAQ
jgi:hypothetical protein